jgi:F-type H+-transporting ATPase subunit delta
MTVNTTLARRYAIAVYSLAVERGAVERVGADLERIVSIIEGDEQTKQFFLAPVIDRYEKERVLAKAFDGRVDEVAFHTLLLLVRKHRETLLASVLEEYRAFQLAGRGVEPLTIASARPLSDDALKRLVERVEAVYGKRFEPRLVVDPTLVGGARLTMGDRLIDGTVAGRLDEMARRLETTTA